MQMAYLLVADSVPIAGGGMPELSKGHVVYGLRNQVVLIGVHPVTAEPIYSTRRYTALPGLYVFDHLIF